GAEAQPPLLASLAVEIEQRRRQLVEVGLVNHLLVHRRHAVLLEQIAELARRAVAIAGAAAVDRLVQRDLRAAARAPPPRRGPLWREREHPPLDRRGA